MNEEMMGMMLGGIFLITPIVYILTKHQQKMAMILNGQSGQAPQQRPAATDAELAALRDIVHRQTLAIDDLARSQGELRAALEGRERVSGLN